MSWLRRWEAARDGVVVARTVTRRGALRRRGTPRVWATVRRVA